MQFLHRVYAVPLILASASPIRRAMLEQAGVAHRTIPSAIDEASRKGSASDPRTVAIALAEAKACAVSEQHGGEWVIGSDSIVSVGGRTFDKPADRDEAIAHLRLFSGKRMQLASAVALARDGAVDWSHGDRAELQVRDLSDRFITSYLDQEWPAVGCCVGVFRMEGRGVQLFDLVEGSYFTILGMPLIPLLVALRERGLLAA